jgi:hypothetical protein
MQDIVERTSRARVKADSAAGMWLWRQPGHEER